MTELMSHDEYVRALILPGGKVDPDAVRLAIGDEAREDESSESEGLCRVSFKLSRDLNKRLDRYLTDRITFMSRNQLQKLIDLGGVTVNGRAPKCSTKLRLGDEIDIALPPPPSKEIQPEDIPIDVLFEDDDLIVLNKSPDIIVHPARSHHSGTLLNALVHHFNQQHSSAASLSSVGEDKARPGVVHRLDRKTSGVMVVAKDDEAHWKLGRQFENRQVDKRYLAIVHGVIESDADAIELPIGPHFSKAKGQREKMIVRHDDLGKHALTLFRVRQRFEPQARATPGRVPPGFTLVELELKTGRTHQIRVHLAHLGFPLVGDDMYAGHPVDLASFHSAPGPKTQDSGLFSRQALHAALLAFRHPRTNKRVEFTAPLPADMLALVCALRASHDAPPVLDIPGATIDLARAIPEERD